MADSSPVPATSATTSISSSLDRATHSAVRSRLISSTTTTRINA
ncbi:hypothetical protein [Micromonospora endophytica]|nr:hypothetical protein [Micromonospora endophytica]